MPTSLWDTWLKTVVSGPDLTALIEAREGGATYSRRELTVRAEQLAAAVPSSRVAGATVAFCEGNGVLWIAKFLALQKLGAVALPLDAALPPARRTTTAVTLGAHWMWEADASWHPLAQDQPPMPTNADYCLVKTTSGTTGQPKPLLFTSANMLADGRQIAVTMKIGPEDRNLGAIPFGHSYGLGNLVLPLIAQGTLLVCSTEILPDALAAQIEHHHVTVLPSVPAVLRALAESSVEASRLRSLRRVISAGAPLRPEAAAGFLTRFGVPAGNFYGSSETGGICFDRTGEEAIAGGGVGQPLEGVEVWLDEDSRVTVRSAAVLAPGEYTLADLGTWNERGGLVLTGRATPWANIGGKKVLPAEIERALRALEGVTDAWVGVQTRAASGEDFLLAAVETRRTGEAIRQALAEHLPTWQLPRQWWIAAQLPRTDRGKLDRRELEARCADGK